MKKILICSVMLPTLFTLSDAALAAAQVMERFAGTVIDQSGSPLAGATVDVNGTVSQTAKDGYFEIYSTRKNRYTINAKKNGYVLASKIESNLYGNSNLNITVQKAEVFPVFPFKPNKISDSHGTQIELPAQALVDSAGKAPTVPVNMQVYTYNLATEAMPGDMSSVNSAGQSGYLESAGAFFAEFVDAAGNKYNLAPGKQAVISIPAISTQPTVNLWSYVENQGVWKEDAVPAKLVNGRYTGNVNHFSVWNFDWQKKTPACVKISVDKAFFDTYKQATGNLTIKATVTAPGISNLFREIALGNIGNAVYGDNALYNLPANAILSIFTGGASTPIQFSSKPVYTTSTGTPWGGIGIPPSPYNVCNGKAVLTLQTPPTPPPPPCKICLQPI
jgi:hypothetical protein